MQRALSPPSCNNKNGLTTTKNNVMAPSPVTTVLSPPRQSVGSPTPQIQYTLEDEPSNIIYSHSGVMGKPEIINGTTSHIRKIHSSVRSYGADGSLLRKIG